MPHDSTGCERVQIVDICVAGTAADLLRISGGERLAKVRYPWWVQLIAATHSANFSAGV